MGTILMAHDRLLGADWTPARGMERLFWPLIHEWTNREWFANLEEARSNVFQHILAWNRTEIQDREKNSERLSGPGSG